MVQSHFDLFTAVLDTIGLGEVQNSVLRPVISPSDITTDQYLADRKILSLWKSETLALNPFPKM